MSQAWWYTGLPASQRGTIFNQFVRARYRYGLVVVGPNEKVIKKWMETALRAILKTTRTIGQRVTRKLEALLQMEQLTWSLERKARRTIRKWMATREEDEAGEKGTLCALALEQVRLLQADSPLKDALDRHEKGEVEDEAKRWIKRWSEAVRPEGERQEKPSSRRPPHVQIRRTFP